MLFPKTLGQGANGHWNGGAGVDMDSDRFLHEIGLGFTPAYSNTDAQGEWSSDPSIDWNDPVAVTGWEGAEDDGTWNALVASGGAIPFSLGGGLSSIGNQHLEPGSFVLAADVVSGAGDGDTYAGLSRLNKELGIPVAPSGTQGSSTGGPISGSIRGPGSGLDDTHVTSIDGRLPAAVSTGEIVVTKVVGS